MVSGSLTIGATKLIFVVSELCISTNSSQLPASLYCHHLYYNLSPSGIKIALKSFVNHIIMYRTKSKTKPEYTTDLIGCSQLSSP